MDRGRLAAVHFAELTNHIVQLILQRGFFGYGGKMIRADTTTALVMELTDQQPGK